MERFLLPEETLNGGFPEPPASEPMRLVSTRHDACGAETRVRLPSTLPARAVRRLRCAGCEQAFETGLVEEIAVGNVEEIETDRVDATEADPVAAIEAEAQPQGPASPPPQRRPGLASLPALPKLPSLPKLDPESRTWKLASVPIAAALVIGGLLLLRGGDDPSPLEPPAPAPESPEAPAPPTAGGAANGGGAANSGGAAKTKLVRGSSYSLALPAGWEQVDPSGGATFAAVAADGGADATLWIEEDAGLDFPTFVNQSLRQLEQLAGSARVVERVPAPTPEATVVRLAADSPPGQPTYEVTLRAAGPYRFYLATSVQPDASAEAIEGAELVAGTFTPEVSG